MFDRNMVMAGLLAAAMLCACDDGQQSELDPDVQAQQQIDESNMDDQLKDLEQEIDAPDTDLP